MPSMQITGRSGEAVAIAESTLAAVASELDGSLLRPDDADYAESVSLWNAMVARRPAVVIRAGSTRDVVRAVTFAREEGLELSIKGGGHNIAGLSLSDGGVTLDLSGLRTVDVDADRGLARVAPAAPSATWTGQRRPTGSRRPWASCRSPVLPA